MIARQPNFAPDGFAGSPAGSPLRQQREAKDFFAAVAAAASGDVSFAAERASENHGRRQADHEQYHHNDDGYDDGLVHSHGWATSCR